MGAGQSTQGNIQQVGSMLPRSSQVTPIVKSARVLGIVSDPNLNRDSCAAVFINGRALWTTRDTQPVGLDGLPTLPVWSSSASWSNFNPNDLSPDVSNGVLNMYGTTHQECFFPLPRAEAGRNTAGSGAGGTRLALWPDSPPMVAATDLDGSVVLYTWVKQSHITHNLVPLHENPNTILYRMNYSPSDSGLPPVTLVDDNFWANNTLSYGSYGNVVYDGTAYLWARAADGTVALAKVAACSIEDKTQYQYFVDGAWSNNQPAIDNPGINIPNASAGGQGTYYYSQAWQSFVWIGQATMSIHADFFITTAPDPTGPWATPQHFYSGENGNGQFPAYSLQANPGLGNPGGNGIYLTYTKSDIDNYSTPLIEILWQ